MSCGVGVCVTHTQWKALYGEWQLVSGVQRKTLYHRRFHNLVGAGKTNLERDIKFDEIRGGHIEEPRKISTKVESLLFKEIREASISCFFRLS